MCRSRAVVAVLFVATAGSCWGKWVPSAVAPLYESSHAPGAMLPETGLLENSLSINSAAILHSMRGEGEGEVSSAYYMDNTQSMPPPGAFDARTEPENPDAPASALSDEDQRQLENRITVLSTAVNSASNMRGQTRLSRSMLSHLVVFSINLPGCTGDFASNCTVALGRSIAAMAGVADDDVIVESTTNTPDFDVVVVPSSEYEYEGSPQTIAYRITMALRSGSLARNLHVNGLDIKLNAISVPRWPELEATNHWIARFTVSVDGTDLWELDMGDMATKLAELLGLTRHQLFAYLEHTATAASVQISVYLVNTTSIPSPVEEALGLQDAAACAYWMSRYIGSAAVCSPYTIARDTEYREPPASALAQGMISSEPCFGHGVVVDNLTCLCDDAWKDVDCSKRRCPVGWLDRAGYLPQLECSGQGACSDSHGLNECTCEPGYAGADCSIVQKCSNGEEQCSGQGTCTPNDAYPHLNYTCKCFAGFSGDQCQHGIVHASPKCPKGVGKQQGKWAVWSCSARGLCECSDGVCKCACNPGWEGISCSIKSCTDNCNSRGECFDGECVCDVGWSGPACNVKHGCEDNSGCNHRGACVSGFCECREFFAGLHCETDNCEVAVAGSAGRRVVAVTVQTNSNNQLSYFFDEHHSVMGPILPLTNLESHHCLAPGPQSITLEATGPIGTNTTKSTFRIDYGVPGNIPMRGGAASPRTLAHAHRNNRILNQTKVHAGGPLTKNFTIVATCLGSNPCSGHGECVEGRCCCDVGYQGDACDQNVTALNIPSLDWVTHKTNTTRGSRSSHWSNGSDWSQYTVYRPDIKGLCVPGHMMDVSDDSACVCTRAMAHDPQLSKICTSDACPTAPGAACGVCSGHGDCHNGTCVCDQKRVPSEKNSNIIVGIEGWYGPACHMRIHCPRNCNEASGHGACDVETGRCACASGFSGDACENVVCPGPDGRCSGNGQCRADGTCLCNARYKGAGCESRACIGGCMSGNCANGVCECKTGWTGAHCETPPVCQGGKVFTNCSTGCHRSCIEPEMCAQINTTPCIADCDCPASRPLWDEHTQACVTEATCPDACWSSLTPAPDQISMSIPPGDRDGAHEVKNGVTYVCRQAFRVCYKAGADLINPAVKNSVLAQSRSYGAPVGLMMYDAQAQPIHDQWGRVDMERSGHPTAAFGADYGSQWVSVEKFGRVDITFYTMHRSSTSPVTLATLPVFMSDCSSEGNSGPHSRHTRLCPVANTPDNGVMDCDGRRVGATCTLRCNEGYMPSHPTRLTSVCAKDLHWSRGMHPTTCIADSLASTCMNRDGDVCTPISLSAGSSVGVCVNGACQARPASAFCAFPPQPETSCPTCSVASCNSAMTACEVSCTGVAESMVAVCEHGPMGGWWNVPDCPTAAEKDIA